jgi:hypothetical protein
LDGSPDLARSGVFGGSVRFGQSYAFEKSSVFGFVESLVFGQSQFLFRDSEFLRSNLFSLTHSLSFSDQFAKFVQSSEFNHSPGLMMSFTYCESHAFFGSRSLAESDSASNSNDLLFTVILFFSDSFRYSSHLGTLMAYPHSQILVDSNRFQRSNVLSKSESFCVSNINDLISTCHFTSSMRIIRSTVFGLSKLFSHLSSRTGALNSANQSNSVDQSSSSNVLSGSEPSIFEPKSFPTDHSETLASLLSFVQTNSLFKSQSFVFPPHESNGENRLQDGQVGPSNSSTVWIVIGVLLFAVIAVILFLVIRHLRREREESTGSTNEADTTVPDSDTSLQMNCSDQEEWHNPVFDAGDQANHALEEDIFETAKD